MHKTISSLHCTFLRQILDWFPLQICQAVMCVRSQWSFGFFEPSTTHVSIAWICGGWATLLWTKMMWDSGFNNELITFVKMNLEHIPSYTSACLSSRYTRGLVWLHIFIERELTALHCSCSPSHRNICEWFLPKKIYLLAGKQLQYLCGTYA